MEQRNRGDRFYYNREGYEDGTRPSGRVGRQIKDRSQTDQRTSESYRDPDPSRQTQSPQSPQSPQPQPTQPPHPHYGYPPPQGPLGRAFSENFYIRLFIMGIILFLVGYIISTSSNYMEAPDEYDYTDDADKYRDDLDTYQLIVRSLTTTGAIIKMLGLIVITLGLFVGAVVDEKLPPLARLGMFIAVGLLLGFQF